MLKQGICSLPGRPHYHQLRSSARLNINGLYSDGSAEGISVWLHAGVQNALKYVNRLRGRENVIRQARCKVCRLSTKGLHIYLMSIGGRPSDPTSSRGRAPSKDVFRWS